MIGIVNGTCTPLIRRLRSCTHTSRTLNFCIVYGFYFQTYGLGVRASYATITGGEPKAVRQNGANTVQPVRQRVPKDVSVGQSGLQTELTKAASVVDTSNIPSETDLLKALETCERLAKSISKQVESVKRETSNTPTNNLLTLEEHRGRQVPPAQSTRVLRSSWKDGIEAAANRIITDDKTFITPQILRVYVNTLSTLDRPQSFPEIFDLYAAKPTPVAGTSPIAFRHPEPTSYKAAIPLDIARVALNASIESRNLALCLNIVSTTVATTAFRRNKVIRKVSLPAVALSLTPWASYEMAIAYMEHSPRTDPDYAFYLPFLAFLTFFSMTSLTGYIAVTTTANVDRVTWRPGTALYQRWTREDERAFADEIAQAWGFQNHLKRGEEEGKDWDNLRQWLMSRRMDLDRPDLMEGME